MLDTTVRNAIESQNFTFKEIDNILSRMVDMMETRAATNDTESSHIIASRLIIFGIRQEFQQQAIAKASGEEYAGQENKE